MDTGTIAEHLYGTAQPSF